MSGAAVVLALASASCFGLALTLTQFGLRDATPSAGAAISIPTSTLLFVLAAPVGLADSSPQWAAVPVFACVGLLFPAAVTLITFEANRRLARESCPGFRGAARVPFAGRAAARRPAFRPCGHSRRDCGADRAGGKSGHRLEVLVSGPAARGGRVARLHPARDQARTCGMAEPVRRGPYRICRLVGGGRGHVATAQRQVAARRLTARRRLVRRGRSVQRPGGAADVCGAGARAGLARLAARRDLSAGDGDRERAGAAHGCV